MNANSSYKTFIFNEKIDSEFLFSMYEDDFPYLEEVFHITLSQLEPDLEQVKQAFEQKDLTGLRKAVHKVKPSFGYTGLLQLQESCRQFEELCDRAGTFEEVMSDYGRLVGNMAESRNIIENEWQKLKKFNSGL
ncbi:MAG TPA: Hpt domain-containing protein [Chitinophagaceae bacterium]|nr:Hpt domain-containing protein [Chitinophagaceae bacterium]